MSCKLCDNVSHPITRRDILREFSAGFGMLALAGLLADDTAAQALCSKPSSLNSHTSAGPLALRPPMFPARAKRIIFLFMHGGPSQVDTFDPKPLLTRDSGKPFPGEKPRVQFSQTGNLLR